VNCYHVSMGRTAAIRSHLVVGHPVDDDIAAGAAISQRRDHGTDCGTGRADACVLDAPVSVRSPVADHTQTFVKETGLTDSQTLAVSIDSMLQRNGIREHIYTTSLTSLRHFSFVLRLFLLEFVMLRR
jgi:hypothetical protein